MKKHIFYSLALMAGVLAFTGCKSDEDMIFDDSAANRLDKAQAEYYELLCRDGGKWSVEYFANADERGYEYVMTFSPDGSVVMATQNDYVTKYSTERSLWQVIADNGVVLSFNTYNSIFHLMSDPDSNNNCYGDYEFVFLSIEDNGNTIRMKGKKFGVPMEMRRLDPSTDDADYIARTYQQNLEMFSSVQDTCYLDWAPTGERFVITGASTGVLSVWPEKGDNITQTESGNVIITATALRFMTPLAVSVAASANDSIHIERFTLQSDGSLLCDDTEGAGSRIYASPVADMFMQKYSWGWDIEACTGTYATLIAQMASEFKAKNGTLTSVVFATDAKTGAFTLTVSGRFRSGATTKTNVYSYNLQRKRLSDTQVALTAGDGVDSGSTTALSTYPSLQALVSSFEGCTATFSATNVLNPDSQVMTLPQGTIPVKAQ